jgi:hypothetical protein
MYHPDVVGLQPGADTALPVIAIDNVPGSVIIETFPPPAASCCSARRGRVSARRLLPARRPLSKSAGSGRARSLNASAAAPWRWRRAGFYAARELD